MTTAERRQDGEKTPEAQLRDIIRQAIAERADLRDLPQKGLAKIFGISPAVMGPIDRGEFPGQPKHNSLAAIKKHTDGKRESLVRICDALRLDLHATLGLVGLDADDMTIEKIRRKGTAEVGGEFTKETLDQMTLLVEALKGVDVNGEALQLLGRLVQRFGHVTPAEANIIAAIGKHLPRVPEAMIGDIITSNRGAAEAGEE